MNSDNGALEFDAYFNNEKLKTTAAAASKAVKDFTDTAVASGEKIDAAFDVSAENIKIQKDVITQLSVQLKNIKLDIANMAPGDGQKQLKQQAAQVSAELQAERIALKLLQEELKETGAQNTYFGQSFNAATKGGARLQFQMQQVMRELPAASLGLNTFILAISNNLPYLTDEIKRASEEFRTLKSEGKTATPVWKQLVSGIFSWQSALVIGITILTMYGKEIGQFFKNLFSRTKDLDDWKKAINDVNTKTSEGASKSMVSINSLSLEWSKLGNNLQEKKKFIEENKDKFHELGIEINSVKDAENALIQNKDAFVESVKLKAKAAASMEIAAEKYKEGMNKMYEAEKLPEKVNNPVSKPSTSIYAGMGASIDWEMIDNPARTKAVTNAENIIKEGDKLIENGVKLDQEAIDKLNEAGIKVFDKVKKQKEKTYEELIEQTRKYYEAYKDAISNGETEAANIIKQKLPSGIATFGDYIKKEIESAVKNKDVKKLAILSPIYNKINEEIKKEAEENFKNFEHELDGIKNDTKQAADYINKLNQLKAKVTGSSSKLSPDQQKKAVQMIDEKSSEASKKELDKILDKYRTTQGKLIELQNQYNYDSIALNKALSEAKTEDEKKAILDSIKARKEAFNNDKSNVIVEDLMNSADWKKIFSNLETVSTAELLNIKNKIEAQFANLNLAPDDLAALRKKLYEITDQIEKRNPFKALSEALKKYKGDESKANFKEVMKDVGASIDAVKNIFDQVVGSLDKMGIKADEGTKQVLADISGMMQGASDLAKGIATGNPLQIIQGSISLISNGIDLIAGGKDRKLERSIQRHAAEVENLKDKYEQLERAVDKALGSDRYQAQKATIDNLKKQQREYAAMAQAEQDKKKTDSGKVREYQNNYIDAANKIEDTIKQIREDILGSDAASVANDLGTAIIDAFANGEDAAVAWGKKVDEVVGNVVKKMLIQKLVEQPVGQIINKYLSSWVDSSGNFIGFDRVMSSAEDMGKELAAMGPGLTNLIENLPDDIKKYLVGDSKESAASKTGLSGAIQGASEETVSMLSGYANAIRINQIESISILRSQLLALDMIQRNTSYNINLVEILSVLRTIAGNNTLRSQGLGN